MKFTDEQLMLYADGNLDKKTTSQIDKALKKDKKLFDRILTFKLANEAMFDFLAEQETMSDTFFQELQQTEKETIQRQAPVQSREQPSLISRFIKGVMNFDPLPTGFASAAAAAFALVITFQVQTSNNENLARDFFASMERKERYSQKDTAERRAIVVANIKDLASKIVTRGDFQEVNEDDIVDNINDETALKMIINSENDMTCSLPKKGFLANNSKVEVKFTAPFKGSFNLLYKDATGKKSSAFSRPNILVDSGQVRAFTSTVKPPFGEEYLQYILKKKPDDGGKIETGLFEFTTIDKTENFFSKFQDIEFIKKPRSIFSRRTSIETTRYNIGLNSLSVTDFGTTDLSDVDKNIMPAIWEKDGLVFIDITGDDFANIVSTTLPDNLSTVLIVDRNGNQKKDALITSLKASDGQIFYQWLLDENEDGKADLLANDCDGNWELDQIFPL
mgnify:CR=1 FL=1